MEKTVTFTMTESQAKSFEKLLDEFNNTMSRIKTNEANKEGMSKFNTETHLLLSQAREELRKIKKINSNHKKMIWEQ